MITFRGEPRPPVPVVPVGLDVYRESGRRKMREEGRCRMCLTTRRRRGAHQLTRHHLVPQEWFARWINTTGWPAAALVRDADANIVPLCRRCHNDVETDLWARWMLRKVLGAAEVAFVIAVVGEEWLCGRYPSLPPVRRDVYPARPHGADEDPGRTVRAGAVAHGQPGVRVRSGGRHLRPGCRAP